MGLTRAEALAVLGLTDGCTEREVRERFKKLALRWHPDKNPYDAEECQTKFQAISAAYSRLTEDEDAEDDILSDLFAEMRDMHNSRFGYSPYGPNFHLFCDCSVCRDQWQHVVFSDFLRYNNPYQFYPEEDDDYEAEGILRDVASHMYRNYSGQFRAAMRPNPRPSATTWRGSQTREEASRNAEELLKAEEEEKKLIEKKKNKNRKKKEAKKRKKAKTSIPTEPEAKEKETEAEAESSIPAEASVPADPSEGEGETEEEEEEEEEGEEGGEKQRQDSDSDSDSELDVNCAFFARANKKSEELLSRTKTSSPRDGASVSAKPLPPETSGPSQGNATELIPPKAAAPQSAVNPPVPPPARGEPSKSARKQPGASITTKPNPLPRQKQRLQNGFVPKRGRSQDRAGPTVATQNRPPPRFVPPPKFVPLQNGTAHSESGSSSGSDSEGTTTAINTGPSLKFNEASSYEPNIDQSRQLAGQGNRAAKDGQFREAVIKFSEAIELYPFDHRYYGNRSFCYEYLQKYSSALHDANTALKLESAWPKGFYRKGRALHGLKKYKEAEAAFERALQLNPDYKEAADELFGTKLEQLLNMGFPSDVSAAALQDYHTVQASLDAILSGLVKVKPTANGHSVKKSSKSAAPQQQHKHRPPPAQPQEYEPVYSRGGFELPPRMAAQASPTLKPKAKSRSLWVGNIDKDSITEDVLYELFEEHGEIESLRLLSGRHCAFVNYSRASAAAKALKAVQGHELLGCSLLIRYPDNTLGGKAEGKISSIRSATAAAPASRTGKKPEPVDEEECFFWRTTGCRFGSKCRFRHVPEHKGIDGEQT